MMRDRPVVNGYGELVTKLRELVGNIYYGGCMKFSISSLNREYCSIYVNKIKVK